MPCIHRLGPWRGIDQVEYATLDWVDWFNNVRLFEPIGDNPPENPGRFSVAMEIISVDPLCEVRLFNQNDPSDFDEQFIEVVDNEGLERTATDDGRLNMYALRCEGTMIILLLPTDNYNYVECAMLTVDEDGDVPPTHRLFR